MRSVLLLLTLITLGTFPLRAQFGIIPSREGKETGTGSGLGYQLPMHEMVFSVEIERTAYSAGRFSAWAEELLGLEVHGTGAPFSYRLGRITLSSNILADPDCHYMLDRLPDSRRSGEDVALFSGQGILQYYGRATHAGRSSRACEHGVAASADWVSVSDAPEAFPLGMEFLQREQPLTSFSGDSLAPRPALKASYAQKSEKELAREAAARLLEIREARYRLLSGYQEVEYSKEALAYMVEGLREMEEDYLRLFKGFALKERRVYRLPVLPTAAGGGGWVPFFRFSAGEGLHDLSSTEGELVFVKWTPLQPEALPDTTRPALSAPAGDPGPQIWYRIPALTLFELRRGDEILHHETWPVAQLGRLQHMNISRLSLEYDPS
ncbi:MAG TPA: DUF4831 family protein, partial [Bacteroidales bacterium]|nr:DUF4831 family protein [Bacteroidales bacterium]